MSRPGGAKLKYKEKISPRREFDDMVLPRAEASAASHAKVTKTDQDVDEATIKLTPAPPSLAVAKSIKPESQAENPAKKARTSSSPLPKPKVVKTQENKNRKKHSVKDADTVVTPPAPKQIRIEQAIAKKKSKAKISNSVLLFALFSILLMTAVALTPRIRATFMSAAPGANAKLDRDNLEQFVNFHRHQVGGKLNRDRLGVEIENEMTAPPLGRDVKRVPAPNMLNGLPLAGETFSPSVESPDARREQMNPDFPDARTAYNLQEQQDEAEWERRAQKQYVDEFVANAQRAGYKVKIDKYGHVTVLGKGPGVPDPMRDEDGDQAPSFPGAVR